MRTPSEMIDLTLESPDSSSNANSDGEGDDDIKVTGYKEPDILVMPSPKICIGQLSTLCLVLYPIPQLVPPQGTPLPSPLPVSHPGFHPGKSDTTGRTRSPFIGILRRAAMKT
jgi:hypothetical protein